MLKFSALAILTLTSLTLVTTSAFANPSVEVCRAKIAGGKNLSISITRTEATVSAQVTVEDKLLASFTDRETTEGMYPGFADAQLLKATNSLGSLKIITPEQESDGVTVQVNATARIKNEQGRTVLRVTKLDMDCSF